MIRLISLCFTLACLAAFIWFGVTVDLGERTLFGHLRAIAGSQESEELWEGTKAKVRELIGIEAAQKAAKRAEAAGKAAKDATRSYLERGGARTLFEPPGPPQERLSERDQQQMNEKMQKLAGEAKKMNMPGRAAAPPEAKRPEPRRAEVEKPEPRAAQGAGRPAPAPGAQGRTPPREADKARAQQPKPI